MAQDNFIKEAAVQDEVGKRKFESIVNSEVLLDIINPLKESKEASPTIVTPGTTGDLVVYYKKDAPDQGWNLTQIRDIVGITSLVGFVSGFTDTNFDATTPGVTLGFFDTADEETGTNVVKTVANTGMTVSIPVRWEIQVALFFRAAGSAEFEFELQMDGVKFGRSTFASGDGTGRARSAFIQGITPVSATPPSTSDITVVVKNNGDTINSIGGTMKVKFSKVS